MAKLYGAQQSGKPVLKRQRKPKPFSKSVEEEILLITPRRRVTRLVVRPRQEYLNKEKIKTEEKDSHIEARTKDECFLPLAGVISDVKESRNRDKDPVFKK